MTERPSAYSHFRLNFEQQQKRAKDLLEAARAGEPEARSRFKSTPKLAEAQYLSPSPASWLFLRGIRIRERIGNLGLGRHWLTWQCLVCVSSSHQH